MQNLEIPLSVVTACFLFTAAVPPLRRWTRLLLLIAGGLLVLHLLFEVVRWQMTPTYLLLAAAGLSSLRAGTRAVWIRASALVVGAVMLGSSCFLGSGLPILELPGPSGPFDVGTTSFSVVDSARAELRSPDPDDARELFVEAWYPATVSETRPPPRPRSLWPELHAGPPDRVSFWVRYLSGVATHSFHDVPVEAESGPYPLVLFNHGLQMFTSQNTLLMEHLASHGFVVVSVGHPYDSIRVRLARAGTVLPEFIRSLDAFRQAMAWIETSSRPVLEAQALLPTLPTREERAAAMLGAIQGSPVNEIVSLWVEDTRFVLDHLRSPEASHLPFSSSLDLTRVGVAGMSVGGATAAELCKVDVRCDVGINVDGLQYGTHHDLPLQVPFLMLYSEDGAGLNDMLMLSARAEYHEYRLVGSRHVDLTDLSVVWPILETYGQTGSVPALRASAILNHVVLGFLRHHLQGVPLGLDPEDLPELEMHSWGAPDDQRR